MQKTKDRLTGILAMHTGQTKEKLTHDMERNYYLSAEEAKAYGIVDVVLPGAK
jgi:ATP-dependent Clp protease protease subunit